MHASRLRTIIGPAALAVTGLALTACGAQSTTGTTLGVPAGATGTTTASAVYVETIDSTGPEQRPAGLTLDNHDTIDGLTWAAWGSPTTTGRGTVHIDDCDPDCASGHDQDIRATITLTDIKTVDGHQEYTTFTLTWPGQSTVDAKTWSNVPLGH